MVNVIYSQEECIYLRVGVGQLEIILGTELVLGSWNRRDSLNWLRALSGEGYPLVSTEQLRGITKLFSPLVGLSSSFPLFYKTSVILQVNSVFLTNIEGGSNGINSKLSLQHDMTMSLLSACLEA